MIYQLPTGKVIEISTEQYLQMSDEELEYLIAYNHGETMEDPWFGSVLSKRSSSATPPEDSSPLEDLIDTPEEQKISDLDSEYNIEED